MSNPGISASNRLVPFSLRSLVSALGLSSVVFSFFLTFSVLLARSGSSEAACLLLIHVGSVGSLYVYWRLGHWGAAKFDCFGAALLLFSLFLRLQAVVDLLFFGARVEAIPSTVPIGDQVVYWLLKGEILTHVGVLLIVSAWRLTIGGKIEEFSFIRNYRSVSVRLSWTVYFLALALAAFQALGGATLGALAQIGSITYSFGVVSVYFIASQKKQVGVRVLIASLLALPMMILALGSGMKVELFFPAVPATLLYWFGYRSVLSRTVVIAFGVGLLTLSQLYVQHVRYEVWYLKRDVSTLELVSGFVEQLSATAVYDGLDSISDRVNLTTSHTVTVVLADVYGHEPFNVFGTIPASFIPRILWPGKPVMQPGAMHTARIHAYEGPLSEVGSSTAPGFSTELYLGGAYVGFLLGSIIFGWLLAAAQKLTLRRAAGFGHLGFSFMTVYWALRLDELAIVYAYPSVVLAAIFALIFSRVGSLMRLKPRVGLIH